MFFLMGERVLFQMEGGKNCSLWEHHLFPWQSNQVTDYGYGFYMR